jgi:hypothetical protein
VDFTGLPPMKDTIMTPRSLLSTRSLLCASLVAGTLVPAIASADETVVRDHREASPNVSGPTTTVRYRRAPGPRIMLPLKIDIGATGANTDRGMAEGVAGSIGIHWASLSPRPTNFDIGLGVFGGLMVAPVDHTVMDDKNGVAYGGAYLEVGHTLSSGTWWRTWASGRGEYLSSTAFDESAHKGVGVSARLSAELYASGVGVEPRGIFLGTYAIGAYVEAGARDMVDGVGDFQMTAGLTFRTPMVIR